MLSVDGSYQRFLRGWYDLFLFLKIYFGYVVDQRWLKSKSRNRDSMRNDDDVKGARYVVFKVYFSSIIFCVKCWGYSWE